MHFAAGICTACCCGGGGCMQPATHARAAATRSQPQESERAMRRHAAPMKRGQQRQGGIRQHQHANNWLE